jgi:ABC-type phosphate transport system substrate-binding protein
MTRFRFLLAAATVATIVACTSVAFAGGTGTPPCVTGAANCHVIGDGSSAQFLTAALGADNLALTIPGVGVPTFSSNSSNCNTEGDANAVYHWSFKNGANILDERAGGLINPQLGNIWVVWVAACSDATGATGITDIWTDVSEDSTVGVRTYFAKAVIQVITPTGTGGNLVSPSSLWTDNAVDVAALPGAIASALGTSSAGTANATVNAGLTDIRPEDALFATDRSNSKLVTSTYAGLGYVTSSANIGTAISTSQGTGTSAQPVNFALSGADPITGNPVPAYVTVPIGAAPIIFVFNNGSAASYPTDAVSGVTPGLKETGQKYPLANLFDGTTDCENTNPAFDVFYGGTPTATAINVVLREPLSGTMNTTEFNLFRSYGNPDDSQEKGINPSSANNNPLNLPCSGGGGKRERAIGTGEVVSAVQGNANTLGYIFWSFSNAAKFKGQATYNYLTIDGVDPIGLSSAAAQTLPYCPTGSATNCPASLWPNSYSFPNVRNGSYKAWSLLRWVVPADIQDETDAYGPAHLAYATENVVDSTIADYVPFAAGTCTGGSNAGQYCQENDQCASNVCTLNDSLDVYRSHFERCGVYALTTNGTGMKTTCESTSDEIPGVNGPATAGSSFGNSLGGNDDATSTYEAGGDVGGLVEGPFDVTSTSAYGYVKTSGTVHTETGCTGGGYEVTWEYGTKFNSSFNGTAITINGSPYTVCKYSSATVVYVQPDPGTQGGAADNPYVAYSDTSVNVTYPKATTPGILSKHQ